MCYLRNNIFQTDCIAITAALKTSTETNQAQFSLMSGTAAFIC
jgi:hypothetical protein